MKPFLTINQRPIVMLELKQPAREKITVNTKTVVVKPDMNETESGDFKMATDPLAYYILSKN